MSHDLVMLADQNEDIALCQRATMKAEGQRAADALDRTVTARHPVTDEVVATFKPARRAAR